MTERDNDQWLKDAVHEQLQNTPPPPLSPTQAWEQLNHQLKEDRGKRRSRFFKSRTFYATVVVAIVILMIGNPFIGSTFAKLTNMFHSIQGTVVQLFISGGSQAGKGENPPPPTPEEFVILDEYISEKMSLEEAQKQTAFTILIPEKIPEDFVLESVTIFKTKNDPAREVYLNYEGNQRILMIQERLTGEAFGAGLVADADDTTIEKLNVDGYEASLLTFKYGERELIWITPEFYFSVSGKLSREEIIDIAGSLMEEAR